MAIFQSNESLIYIDGWYEKCNALLCQLQPDKIQQVLLLWTVFLLPSVFLCVSKNSQTKRGLWIYHDHTRNGLPCLLCLNSELSSFFDFWVQRSSFWYFLLSPILIFCGWKLWMATIIFCFGRYWTAQTYTSPRELSFSIMHPKF